MDGFRIGSGNGEGEGRVVHSKKIILSLSV